MTMTPQDVPERPNDVSFDNPVPTLKWTWAQAGEATLNAIRAGAHPDDPTLPRARLMALLDLEVMRCAVVKGGADDFVVQLAMGVCVEHQLVVPTWAGSRYLTAIEKVAAALVPSLDDAFGRPYPKGAQLAAIRRRRRWRDEQPRLYDAVRSAIERGEAIDDQLCEKIGRQFAVGKSRAKDLYYDEKHRRRKRFQRVC